jgi:zinc protease
LSQLSNLTLEYRAQLDSLDEDNALFQYNLAYLYGSTFRDSKDYSWQRDTSSLDVSCPKVKIKETKPEPISGGSLWTFSNGIRVVYKQVPGSRMFNYALLLGGGLSGVTGLEEGEGGYFGDMLSLYDAAGMSAPDFRDHLAVNGIDMQTQVSLTFTSIHGSAPSSKLPSLLKALLALANNRTVNRGEFEIYLRNAAWARESVEDRLYKMMYPGFSYTSRKYPSALGQATQAKAAQFWESRFSRVNDGMLVIVGDVDEATVRKDLLKYIGGFRTQRGAESRKAVRYTPVSGGTQKGSEGEKGAYVRLDAEFPLSGVNYVMAEVGADVLRRHVVAALQGTGLSTEVTTGFHSYPQERLWMVVSCEGKKASAALPAIREGIRKAAAATVSQKDVNAYKAMVLSDMNRELTAPETVVSSVVARYGIGKDMVSHYKESVNGITPASLKEMLSALASGRTAEYVVE